jgi:hypothetical protein
MTDVELRKVGRWLTEGGKLFIGTDEDGTQKIKVVHGPLGMFVHRYEINETQLLELKEMILKSMKTQAA